MPDSEELKRMKKASTCKIISLDKEKQRATFAGSAEIPYSTSLFSCTCIDFGRRHKPCKHMYRLQHELGIINIEGVPRGELSVWEESMTPEEIMDRLRKLSDKEKRMLWGLICQWISGSAQNEWVYETNEPVSTKLVEMEFLVEKENDAAILEVFHIRDLRQILKRHGIKCPVSKEKTIDCLMCLDRAEIKPMVEQYKFLVFNEKIRVYRGKIRGMLKEYFEENHTVIEIQLPCPVDHGKSII